MGTCVTKLTLFLKIKLIHFFIFFFIISSADSKLFRNHQHFFDGKLITDRLKFIVLDLTNRFTHLHIFSLTY